MSSDLEEIPPPITKAKCTNYEPFDTLRVYFERDKERIKCLVPDCKGTISRYQLYYFKRHFQWKHQAILREICPEEIGIEKQNQAAALEIMLNAV